MINKNKKSNMTLDKLAILVANSFWGFEKRLNEKIENMATKSDIEDLKNKIEGVTNRIDNHALNKVSYDNFNPLVKRVDALEKT